MNCDLAHDLLQQSLDGTPIESPEWLAHLRQCHECRALALAGRRLQEGLRILPTTVAPADLADRILETIRLERRRARRQTQRRWALALAVAAAVLIALGLRLGWRERPAGTAAPPSESLAKNPPAPKEKSAPTLRESAAELGEIFAALSNQTADETVGRTRRWVSNVPSPTLPTVDLTAMEPSTQPWREAGEGMSEGLQPVTASARRAVDLFLRELPMDQKN
jgi:anti-sigma factor RsiW